MLNCQWVFIVELCLLLCSIFASHSIQNKFKISFFSSMNAESLVSCDTLTFLSLSSSHFLSVRSLQLKVIQSQVFFKRSAVQCGYFSLILYYKTRQCFTIELDFHLSNFTHSSASFYSFYIIIVRHAILVQLCPSHSLYKVSVTFLSRQGEPSNYTDFYWTWRAN